MTPTQDSLAPDYPLSHKLSPPPRCRRSRRSKKSKVAERPYPIGGNSLRGKRVCRRDNLPTAASQAGWSTVPCTVLSDNVADLSIPATSSVPIVSHLYMYTTKNTLPLPHTCTSSHLIPNIQISYRWTSPAGAAAFLPARRTYRRSKSYGHCPSYPSASSCSCSQPLSSPS